MFIPCKTHVVLSIRFNNNNIIINKLSTHSFYPINKNNTKQFTRKQKSLKKYLQKNSYPFKI